MFKKILFLTFIITCCIVFADEFNNSFEGREWEFLQYRFQAKLSGTDLLKTLGVTVGVAGSTILLLGKVLEYNGIECKMDMDKPDTVSVSALWFGIITFFGSLAYYYKQARINAAVSFIKNWPDYKKYTPVYFYQSFEELFEQYPSEGETKAFKDKVCELINIIDRAIFNRTEHQNSTVHLVYFPS